MKTLIVPSIRRTDLHRAPSSQFVTFFSSLLHSPIPTQLLHLMCFACFVVSDTNATIYGARRCRALLICDRLFEDGAGPETCSNRELASCAEAPRLGYTVLPCCGCSGVGAAYIDMHIWEQLTSPERGHPPERDHAYVLSSIN